MIPAEGGSRQAAPSRRTPRCSGAFRRMISFTRGDLARGACPPRLLEVFASRAPRQPEDSPLAGLQRRGRMGALELACPAKTYYEPAPRRLREPRLRGVPHRHQRRRRGD